MNPYLVGVLAAVAFVVLLAYLSNRRDRRNGVDPNLRVQALQERRKTYRRKRADMITRRLGGGQNRNPVDRPEPKPWER